MPAASPPPAYTPNRSLPMKVKRRMTQWRVAKPLTANPRRAIVSFTFDDFPKSAAETGAAIIEEAGGKACFYACTGMAETRNETGQIFDASDIQRLLAAGHEIGAHTQSHLDCAVSPVATALNDIAANLDALKAMGVHKPITQFAYPFGETRYDLKRALPGKFTAVRGVLAGVNTKGSDLMQLRSMELTPDRKTTDRAAKAIIAASTDPAWVIIFTHDVGDTPSPYGTTPEALKYLANLATDNGAALLTPSQALAEIMAHEK